MLIKYKTLPGIYQNISYKPCIKILFCHVKFIVGGNEKIKCWTRVYNINLYYPMINMKNSIFINNIKTQLFMKIKLKIKSKI